MRHKEAQNLYWAINDKWFIWTKLTHKMTHDINILLLCILRTCSILYIAPEPWGISCVSGKRTRKHDVKRRQRLLVTTSGDDDNSSLTSTIKCTAVSWNVKFEKSRRRRIRHKEKKNSCCFLCASGAWYLTCIRNIFIYQKKHTLCGALSRYRLWMHSYCMGQSVSAPHVRLKLKRVQNTHVHTQPDRHARVLIALCISVEITAPLHTSFHLWLLWLSIIVIIHK